MHHAALICSTVSILMGLLTYTNLRGRFRTSHNLPRIRNGERSGIAHVRFQVEFRIWIWRVGCTGRERTRSVRSVQEIQLRELLALSSHTLRAAGELLAS